ncbi:flagellar protein FlaG [Pseudomonas putida]|uniref:Flagellar biosynthesis protein FlaG n=1 Tax=Pseudomonas guariconensis TaxID=1288410 RepID=A0AAX0VZI1_9PSED|nr:MULTISPECIES: flagellar protein FlaG [Pseudomonas]CAB5525337.1 flagellar protein FlaG [Pseudomonas putida]MDD2091711.1 flagellar protein FlaG [Pseudomonas guariconensis]OFS76907.1 flagellar biosynthesis protein FlaG [Pseudomonas sp. HMSC08G10]PLV20080.1 flagellar biosynthesis protein FlaG [Pseudomonas guariconensis]PLV25660.1 flagellar biosynthesis protein FlaG [Pseudomonas guariconensis]
MDMSLKLNLSYQATRQAEQIAEKPVVRPAEVPEEGKKGDSVKVQGVDDVKNAVAEIEKFLNESRRNLEFSTDEESGKIVVKVIASDSGELIRQIPSEEALRIAHSLSDVKSVLFDAKV